MIYRDYKDEQISAFGMGCMRLPVIDGNDSAIDEPAAEAMIDYAYENGCNYFDTAWGYHGGNSEVVVGKALKKYPRESFNLADKFPGYDSANWGKVEEIFAQQLEKAQVDYFDFYLFHNVCEMNIDAYLDPKYRIYDFLSAQREVGKIRHLGFSVHGSAETMTRFLEAYGSEMEFCQIQLNWLDYDFQDAKAKIALCEKYDLPVVVMEPLRGGRLCKLTDEELARIQALRPGVTSAEWSLRWLQSLPQVATVLCGSSTMEQIQENIATFAEDKPLTEEEMAVTAELAKEMTGKVGVPCTACRYCVDHCPVGLNIPWLLELYNEHTFTNGGFMAPMAIGALPEGKKPSDCIACGNCTSVCPQQIDVADALDDFCDKLGL